MRRSCSTSALSPSAASAQACAKQKFAQLGRTTEMKTWIVAAAKVWVASSRVVYESDLIVRAGVS